MLAKRILLFVFFAAYSIGLLFLLLRKKLLLFLHPDFVPLAVAAAIGLAIVALGILLLRHYHAIHIVPWRAVLLCVPLLLIFFTDLRPLSSASAVDRTLAAGSLTIGRHVSASQFATKPEKRSLYQWVIALNADPEPSHYEGQIVKVRGFIAHDASLPADQLLVGRFILTCCAADARLLSLPVRKNVPVLENIADDQWVAIEGKMTVVENAGKRILLVVSRKVEVIAIPDDPYEI